MADAQLADEELLRRLEDATRDAHRLQMETLRTILSHNAGCGYLRPHLLPHSAGGSAAAAADAESFRRLVPLSSYEHYADHIQRMVDGTGDPSVLSLDPLVCFFYSSGSTNSSAPKMIPFYDSQPGKHASAFSHQGSSALLRRIMPPRAAINKILWFIYAGNVRETRSGFKAMAATAYAFHSGGPNRPPSPVLSVVISPPQVILGTDAQQQTYCHLLCGLSNRCLIDAVRAPYAAGLARAIRVLESKWQQLCDDIEHGTVSTEVTDPAMRRAVQNLLGSPQPEEADRIRRICGRESWDGILGELWPEARYVGCVTTGTMEQYYPLLKHYAGSSLPVLSGDYFASECAIGLNMQRDLPPEETTFVIVPNAAYFEFLPFDQTGSDHSKEDLVDISGVEVGKAYEVVATTYRGLYRYRLGDVVRVVGFHNASPKVQFVTRAPKDCSEVITERALMDAVSSLQDTLREKGGMEEIGEYASFLDRQSKHLVIFLEIMGKKTMAWAPPGKEAGGNWAPLLERACSVLETCLGSVYKMERQSGRLGPLEIVVVAPGSFDEMERMAVQNGAPASQYKPPKILRNPGPVELLKAHALTSWRPLE